MEVDVEMDVDDVDDVEAEAERKRATLSCKFCCHWPTGSRIWLKSPTTLT